MLTTEPLSFDPNGVPVFLTDIWPSSSDINMQIKRHVNSDLFEHQYGRIYDGDDFWRNLPIEENTTYPWDEDSTYIKLPPYFEGFSADPVQPEGIDNARLLILLGDSVTTDHISPAGRIPADYPAGSYLMERGVDPEAFGSDQVRAAAGAEAAVYGQEHFQVWIETLGFISGAGFFTFLPVLLTLSL